MVNGNYKLAIHGAPLVRFYRAAGFALDAGAKTVRPKKAPLALLESAVISYNAADWESLMRLESGKNNLQLTLRGYRNPEEWSDPWEANWLVIALAAETAEGAWTVEEPVLLTKEVRYLARWLDDLAAGAGVEALDFLDGALVCRAERRRLPAGLTLSFGMSFRMAPPWVERTPYWISFEPDPAMLARAAADLRRQARGWPPRAGWQHE